MNHDHSQHALPAPSFWGSRYSVGLLVLGGVGLFFLLSEHRAHVLGALPLLIFLACPLMHLFMHRGHGEHGEHGGHGGHGGHGHSHASERAGDSASTNDGGAP